MSVAPDQHLLPVILPAEKTPDSQHLLHRVDDKKSLSYYLFLPANISEKSRVIVCVHGISRNAKEQINAFRERANQFDYIIIAPHFSRKYYQGYQRLEVGAAGYTPVEALHRILDDVHKKYAVKTEKFSLFGYSGGAQFAHRYALFHPEKIDKLIICSAGWFTFPVNDKNYPYGLKGAPKSVPRISKTLANFLHLNITVLVGEFDNINDPGLNRKKRINRQQGYHRLERARRWVYALQSQCNVMKLKSNLRFIVIKGCGHSFNNCERLGDFSKYIFVPDS